MRIMLDYPPAVSGADKEELLALSRWLYSLCDTLNAALSSLGEENLNTATRAKINALTGKETP